MTLLDLLVLYTIALVAVNIYYFEKRLATTEDERNES